MRSSTERKMATFVVLLDIFLCFVWPVTTFALSNQCIKQQKFPTCVGNCPEYMSCHQYEQRLYDVSTWVTATVETTNLSFALSYAKTEFDQYFQGKNTEGKIIKEAYPTIVQIEEPCPSSSGRKFVVSRFLPKVFHAEPPFPTSRKIAVEFQQSKQGLSVYVKVLESSKTDLVAIQGEFKRFSSFLANEGKKSNPDWYYIAIYETGSEMWLQQSSSYYRRTTCPPDDSSFERLCGPSSSYSCPNFTNTISANNIESRTYSSLWVVTSQPSNYEGCSYGHARLQGYMRNHRYFQYNNTMGINIKSTLPVLTKAIKVIPGAGGCSQQYNMYFYIPVETLNKSYPPCPQESGVLIEKVEGLRVYVKTVNGLASDPLENLKNRFLNELSARGVPHRKSTYYIAQYRGHGPLFGRRLEIWVEAEEPKELLLTCRVEN